MSVELQKISDFLLFLVMKYVDGTAEDQWFSPVPSTNKTEGHNITEVLFDRHIPNPSP
jgi:hypothetical protein